MDRFFVIASGALGFLAVVLGAFAAHGLRAVFAASADGAERVAWWQTATQYHLAHALALAFVAWIASRAPGAVSTVAGLAFLAGVLLFSGSLYTMALTGVRWLGAVTPLGGLFFLAGWVAVLIAGVRMSGSP